MSPFLRRVLNRTVPTRVIGGSPRYSCHYCDFTSPDPSETYAHLFEVHANRRKVDRLGMDWKAAA